MMGPGFGLAKVLREDRPVLFHGFVNKTAAERRSSGRKLDERRSA
jgi:16S rRNA C1402 (ribose-2'-O) methylase RsmI